MACPLCLTEGSLLQPVSGPDKREFCICHNCKLIFTPTRFGLSEKEQKKRYEMHNNGLEDKGYVKFLNRAIQPALKYLNTEMRGLDYGCGPVPTLSKLLAMQKVRCNDYDPLFFPVALQPEYDFIFATECFEHFFYPAREVKRLFDLLKKGGYLIIMTEQWESVEEFKTWHYARDLTHVAFYNKATIEYICKKQGFDLMPCDDDRVAILKK